MLEKLHISQEKLNSIYGYIPSIVTAIIILIVGLWVIKRLQKVTDQGLKASKIDEDLSGFMISTVGVILKIFLGLTVANTLGFQTTSFLAILGSAVFAVGLALQGTLSNFASGVMILIFKPYNTGDHIKIGDSTGEVESIQIFNTILVNDAKQTIIIPNSQVLSGVITNLTAKKNVVINATIPVSYAQNFEALKEKLQKPVEDVIGQNPTINIHDFKDKYYNVQINVEVDALESEDLKLKLNNIVSKTAMENHIVLGASGIES
jgi:small conductance mechanosensitive channel